MAIFISLKSTKVTRSYGILTLVTPLVVGEALTGKTVSMVCLVISITKLGSETWCTITNNYTDYHTVPCRSEIDDDLDKVSHACLLDLRTAVVTLTYEPGVLGAVGKIKVDCNGVKHIVHLTRRFDELCNTITTCLYDYHRLQRRFPNPSSGLERRLVPRARRDLHQSE